MKRIGISFVSLLLTFNKIEFPRYSVFSEDFLGGQTIVLKNELLLIMKIIDRMDIWFMKGHARNLIEECHIVVLICISQIVVMLAPFQVPVGY